MELTLEQIRSIAHGAVEVSRAEDGLIRLYRLTPRQRALYQPMGELFYKRACNSSGIKLMLRTDSPTLTLDLEISHCTTRQFFSIDVYSDGQLCGYIEGYGHDTMFRSYRQRFSLGEGNKTVSVYLPWSVLCAIRSVELEDGAQFVPVKRNKTILMYGDSITQGFDVLRPSMSYSARIADWLEAECYNKGVGSAKFDPELVAEAEDLDPDYITVAYGTNDWCHNDVETFRKDSRQFLFRLRQQYPRARLFVLAPIWRKDLQEAVAFGPFDSVYKELQAACETLPNTIVIDCFPFVPADSAFYQDEKLHPNDAGFAHYFENLRNAMAQYV